MEPNPLRILAFSDLHGRAFQEASNLIDDTARMKLLTPGDYANVVRQSRLRVIATSAELLARLGAECDGTRRPTQERRVLNQAGEQESPTQPRQDRH